MEQDSKWLIIVISLLLIIGAGIFFYAKAEEEESQRRYAEAQRNSLVAHIEQQEAEIARLRALLQEKKDK